MKYSIQEKKTILIGLAGLMIMIFSMVLSFYSATINYNFMPLIVFILTCVFYELKETYISRRDKEDNDKK
jgi:uncharacterized membrane protein